MNNISYGWRYEWLISCPHVVFMSTGQWHGHRLYVGIPLVNSRTNIFEIKGKTLVKTTPSPPREHKTLCENYCMEILNNSTGTTIFLESLRMSEDPVIRTAYYGGFNVFIDVGEKEIVTSEIVADNIYVYLDKEPISSYKIIGPELGNLIVLAISLRKGDLRKYWGTQVVGLRDDITGELLVFSENIIPGKRLFKVDNIGIRHVVKSNFVGCRE